MEGQEKKKKDRKPRKSRSEETIWVLAQETGGSHRGWNHGTREIDQLTWRRTQGASVVKGWEDKRDRGHIPDTFAQNKNNTSAGPQAPLTPNNMYFFIIILFLL